MLPRASEASLPLHGSFLVGLARRSRQLTTIHPGVRELLLRAALMVGTVRLALWLLPARAVMKATLRLQSPPSAARGLAAPSPETIAWAVRVVARRIPYASCLTQALSTQALLARDGCESDLRIGVGRDPNGSVCAHAWLELQGRVIIGDDQLDRYARMPDLTSKI
jgi:hypothetical protein